MRMTARERKSKQRQRDKLAGWIEVTVKVAADQAQNVRDYAATLPPPAEPKDPRQHNLIEELDRMLDKSQSSDLSPVLESRSE